MKVISVANGFVIYGRDKCIVVAASSADEKEKWMSDLKSAIGNCPDDKEDDKNFYPSLKSNSQFEISLGFKISVSVDALVISISLTTIFPFRIYACHSRFLILLKVLQRHLTTCTTTAKVPREATSRMSCSIGPTTPCMFVGIGAPVSV